jgi:cellulose synthase/poly-beta-1,6-N-acetylglucosamine synthase-like glycosyltransferase
VLDSLLPIVGMVNGAFAAATSGLALYQISATRRALPPYPAPARRSACAIPFVSVHVATYDEPPELVIATLDALAAMSYLQFEVIVIDNNTPDVATWLPVRRHVASLGSRFRFFHIDEVDGAKAGALSIALALTDPRAEFIAIIDADYCVSPEFLSCATAACTSDLAFVQFPQAYRRSNGAEAICSELHDYFSVFPTAANQAGAALLTGTLSLISISALRAVGGWPTASITEDAELGVRLWRSGAKGRYVDTTVGHGLLPLDLKGLRQQRKRWAAGNMQTLLGMATSRNSIWRTGGSAVAAQLTAWTGFLAIPLLTLIYVALLRLLGDPVSPENALAEYIAAGTILLTLVTIAARAIASGRIDTLSVTLATLWTSSFGWIPALFAKRLAFGRTPKALEALGSRGLAPDDGASIVALCAAAILVGSGSIVSGLVLAIAGAGLFTAPFVDRKLQIAARGVA